MKTHPPIAASPPGPVVRIDGAEYLYFVGTSYLGLHGHPEVIRAACEATERYGIHSATSRAGFGNTPPTLSVERRAAEFFGCEASFCFPSGYAGNSILLHAIKGDFDALVVDEHSHYCVREAVMQSGRPMLRFRHRDAGDLADNLRKHLKPGQQPLLMSDGVFSVRGTIAPLADYLAVLADYPGAGLLVDDAHGVGVLGHRGRGTLEYFGLFDGVSEGSVNSQVISPLVRREKEDCAVFFCATLSKALGGYGGIIPGSQQFIELLHGASHWYDGASAPPAPVAAASARAIEIVQADPDLRTRLWANVRRLKEGLRALGLDADDTPVPIICLELGDAANMRRVQQELMGRGIAVAYMAAYSGLSSAGGLRVAVFATHTEEMIQRLLDELRQVV